jgi:hypothetical protein
MARDDLLFEKSQDKAGGHSLLSFGDSHVGRETGLLASYDKVEYVRVFLNGISRGSSVLCKSGSGGYLTNKLKTAYIGMVKKAAMEQGGYGVPSWAEYNDDYKKWKEDSGYGSKKWIRTGSLLNQVGVINRKASGLSVGFKLKATTPRKSYGSTRGQDSYKAGVIAERMDFGHQKNYTVKSKDGKSREIAGGIPPRPLFMPVYLYFTQNYIPRFSKIVTDSLTAGIQKYGLNNIKGANPSRAVDEAVKVFAEMNSKISSEQAAQIVDIWSPREEKEEDWDAVFKAAIGSVV